MRLLRHGWIALAALVFAACNSDDLGPNISGVPTLSIQDVVVTPKIDTAFFTDSVTASSQVQFVATAFGRRGDALTGLRYVWTSSDPAVATVDSTGLVTAHSSGTAIISASAGKIGKATLVAVPATTTITITPSIDTVFVDDPIVARDTLRLVAKAFDRDGAALTGAVFTWQSSAPNVASVSATGLVRAFSMGTATITARSGDAVATVPVSVLSVVKNVTLTSPNTQVLVGDVVQLKATAFDYNNAPITRRFTWTSSNNNVATVDSLGRATFKTTGSVTFTATTAFRSASTAAPITVSPRQLQSVTVGGDFSCGLAPLGRGFCWGLNHIGQLAPGPGIDSVCFNDALNRATPVTYAAPGAGASSACRLAPMPIARPEVALTQISAGGAFACGVSTDQNLYCWGDGAVGQCGNGKTACGPIPQIATVKTEKFLSVSAGGAHACAIAAISRLGYCWGADSVGQLGDTLKLDTLPPDIGAHSTTPIPVRDRLGGFPAFNAISAGGRHTCGITTAGTALCWGDGGSGQLGNGAQDTSDVAIPASGGATFLSISAGGKHTCAITLAGAALCWGDNTYGQLGTGSIGGAQTTPVQITGGRTYVAISAGDRHTCAVATGFVLYCWGNNAYAQLGNGAFGGSVTPVPIPTPVAPNLAGVEVRFSSVTAGRRHTCGMALDLLPYCWGANLFGSLGDELQAAMRERPQLVATPR